MGHCIKVEVQSNHAHAAPASLPHKHCNYHKQNSSVYTYIMFMVVKQWESDLYNCVLVCALANM